MKEFKFVSAWDNGGKTADRYEIRFSRGHTWGMSEKPTHPQGFCQYAGVYTYTTREGMTSIDYENLPEAVQKEIKFIEDWSKTWPEREKA